LIYQRKWRIARSAQRHFLLVLWKNLALTQLKSVKVAID